MTARLTHTLTLYSRMTAHLAHLQTLQTVVMSQTAVISETGDMKRTWVIIEIGVINRTLFLERLLL